MSSMMPMMMMLLVVGGGILYMRQQGIGPFGPGADAAMEDTGAVDDSGGDGDGGGKSCADREGDMVNGSSGCRCKLTGEKNPDTGRCRCKCQKPKGTKTGGTGTRKGGSLQDPKTPSQKKLVKAAKLNRPNTSGGSGPRQSDIDAFNKMRGSGHLAGEYLMEDGIPSLGAKGSSELYGGFVPSLSYDY